MFSRALGMTHSRCASLRSCPQGSAHESGVLESRPHRSSGRYAPATGTSAKPLVQSGIFAAPDLSDGGPRTSGVTVQLFPQSPLASELTIDQKGARLAARSAWGPNVAGKVLPLLQRFALFSAL